MNFAKGWKINTSEEHVQSVGVETEKKEMVSRGIQTSRSLELRHPNMFFILCLRK